MPKQAEPPPDSSLQWRKSKRSKSGYRVNIKRIEIHTQKRLNTTYESFGKFLGLSPQALHRQQMD